MLQPAPVAQKRIYINNIQLPNTWQATYPYDCQVDSAYFDDPRVKPPGDPNTVVEFLVKERSANIPTIALTKEITIIGYQYTDPGCADCSIRGSTTPPSFWVNGPYN